MFQRGDAAVEPVECVCCRRTQLNSVIAQYLLHISGLQQLIEYRLEKEAVNVTQTDLEYIKERYLWI